MMNINMIIPLTLISKLNTNTISITMFILILFIVSHSLGLYFCTFYILTVTGNKLIQGLGIVLTMINKIVNYKIINRV